MQASRVMMMARKVWPVQAKPPVAHSRRHEIMLAFRPSPEISGFNLHYLAAARWWKNKDMDDIGHIRGTNSKETKKRLDNLPQSLKQEMTHLWKDTSKVKKDGGVWVREEMKRSRFGGNIIISDYWAKAIELSKQFLLDGPSNLLKIMEEGGFLEPDKDHDVEEFSSYMERRLGKRIYTTYRYDKDLKCNTLEGVYVLFDVKTNEVLNHPNQICSGKFRVGSGCITGGTDGGSGGFESGGASGIEG